MDLSLQPTAESRLAADALDAARAAAARNRVALRYAVAAVLASALALAAENLHGHVPEFLLGIPIAATAVMAATLGAGPALVFIAGTAIAVWYFVLEPRGSFAIANDLQLADLGFYFLAALPVAVAVGLLQRERGRLRAQIERQRDTEGLLRRSEALFRAAVDNLPYTFVLYDAERRYRFVNAAALAVTGKRLADLVGKRDEQALPEEAWSSYLPYLLRTVATRERQTFERTRPASMGGGTQICTYVPLVDEAGALEHVMCVTYDVTEIRRAEQALREADRRKDEFLAVLSHELRNPLAPVRNALHILDRAAPGSPQATAATTVISRQVDHLSRLVDDLLDVTRITRGKVRLQPARVDLADVVGRAAEDHRALLAARGVSLDVHLAEGPFPADVDATRVAQIVGNLLQNGAKFTERGGRVTLTLAREQDLASIRVADDGVGIAPEMLGQLFRPFMQADESLDRSRGGLGLGLALVKGLAEVHGGTAEARSEGVGRGAEFVVTLPLVPADEQHASAAPAAPRSVTLVPSAAAAGALAPVRLPASEPAAPVRPPPAAAPAPARAAASMNDADRTRRILLIEDNIDAAETLKVALDIAGHQVEVAHDGRAGVELAREFCPDVVLCDIGLPEMDGYAVARTLRSDPAFAGTALVALTGYGLAGDQSRALDAGFDAHLTKPTPVSHIEETLRTTAPRAGYAEGI